MENNIKNNIPAKFTKYTAAAYSVHLGKILSNISIVCMVICLSSLISTLIVGLTFVFGLIFIILTFGTVFVIIPNYWNRLISSGDLLGYLSSFMETTWPYLAPIGIICAVVSIVLLSMDKYEKHPFRITVSSIIIAITIILLILLIAGV